MIVIDRQLETIGEIPGKGVEHNSLFGARINALALSIRRNMLAARSRGSGMTNKTVNYKISVGPPVTAHSRSGDQVAGIEFEEGSSAKMTMRGGHAKSQPLRPVGIKLTFHQANEELIAMRNSGPCLLLRNKTDIAYSILTRRVTST
jgi:hypothetical protein